MTNQKGYTLQTIIIIAVLVLAAVGAGIVIYNIISDRTSDVEEAGRVPELIPIPPQNPDDFEGFIPDFRGPEPGVPDGPLRPGFFKNDSHVCVVLKNADINCWGYGVNGQLGNGIIYNENNPGRSVPVQVARTDRARAVSTGVRHTCAVYEDTTVSCWGLGNFNALGTEAPRGSNLPVAIVDTDGNPISGYIAVSSGSQFSCALKEAGTIDCWGQGEFGQLGDGESVDTAPTPDEATRSEFDDYIRQLNKSIPVQVQRINDAVSITTGVNHGCALHNFDGSISCWGITFSLGRLASDDISTPPTRIRNPSGQVATGYKAISAGWWHTCGLHTDGHIDCWGAVAGTKTDTNILETVHPIIVLDSDQNQITDFTDLSTGQSLTCGIRTGGTVWCWGLTSSDAFEQYPTQMPEISGAKDIVSGLLFTCALLEDDTVTCWGENTAIQPARGQTIRSVAMFGNS